MGDERDMTAAVLDPFLVYLIWLVCRKVRARRRELEAIPEL
jgi:hypothetical protein